MKTIRILCLFHNLLALALTSGFAADTVWLDSLDLSKMKQGYGSPQLNRSMREKPLAIGGKKFDRGVGTHAASSLWLNLSGGTERFLASVGVDDAAGGGSVVFRVLGDGKKLFDSGVMKAGNSPKTLEVDLHGIKALLLQVTDAGDGNSYDHADWAEARFLVNGAKPQTVARYPEPEFVLTPKAEPAPRLNGPKVYGCRPGKPFLYRIPAQGERPMSFSAEGLPPGLALDSDTGILAGNAPARGEYPVSLHAKNGNGESSRPFRIISGDTLALTPPMGWNHWYAHYDRVTDKMMREAAEVMISSGMADVGYQYVNIDDCWMNAPKNKDPLRVGPLRNSGGELIPNQHFPDMKGLAEFIHGKGLKAGLYISPGPLTCGGFAGSYGHEAQDAKTFAAWGFDFLKYDWCSYGHIAEGGAPNATNVPTYGQRAPSLEAYQHPYILMGNLLQQQNRDIVFNLCQYGMANVWEWGAAVGGHCWRTAGDLGFELDRIFDVALANAEHRAWSKPGAWNDPDYLQIGYVGSAQEMGEPRPCPLTPNEQYAYMSLWALMAAPLVYSGDMCKLDEFTRNVLCNPEVIDVDQDPLGQSAATARLNDETFLMIKDLEDGSKAVGLFNRGESSAEVSAPWPVLGVCGQQTVRDLWRQTDLGKFQDCFKPQVSRHGVILVRISKN